MKRLLALVAALALLAVAPAAASLKTPKGVVVGQTGVTDGWRWYALFSGHGRYRCDAIQIDRTILQSCGGAESSAPWRRIVGSGPLEPPPASIELDVTGLAVRKLKLVLGHPPEGRIPGAPDTRRTITTRRLSAGEARRAGIPRDFRFAAYGSRTANQCVKRVVALSGDGRVLMRSKEPCEF